TEVGENDVDKSLDSEVESLPEDSENEIDDNQETEYGDDGSGRDKENRKWSGLWSHFARYKLSGESNGSTGNMKRHLENKHPEALHSSFVAVDAFTFSQENFREALMRWVIECNQPFTEPQQAAFVALVRTLNPEAKVVSDVKVKSDVMAAYKDKLEELKREVANVPGKISITLDAWTSKNALAFLAIRGHWLDDKWVYRTKLLDFAYIDGEHTGFNLSEIFGECLSRLELPYSKILAITLDNASNNDTFFDWLQEHGLTAHKNRMRCMAHIINLCVQDILRSIKVPYNADIHNYEQFQDELSE
ncbi:Zinc finger BED domain-containing protein RICESLEEPER 2, partial [Pseudolycoriella hygida]